MTGSATPTVKLREGSEFSDLVIFESLGLGKLPRNVASALNTYILLRTEWSPSLGALRAKSTEAVQEASNRQRSDDADALQTLARRGDFEGVAKVFNTSRLADAEAELARANRAYMAVRDAEKGMARYLGLLISREERETFLDSLANAWRVTQVITTDNNTTLGELAALEQTATSARDVIGRLLVYAESVAGADNADKRRLRGALKENRDDLPTLEIIDRETREAAASSPAALRRAAAAKTQAEEKARRSREVAASAAYRRSGKPLEQNTSAAQEEDNNGPETGQEGK
jgi:hypothetical protein